nr:RNA pseudouridine synthase [Clostridia bacterium]
AYLYRSGEYDPKNEQSFVPSLCNRIDRNTGGIVIAAKNAEALRNMNRRIKDRDLTKKYLCAVHGTFEKGKKSGELKGYILKNADDNLVTVFKSGRPGAKFAQTNYRVLAEKDGMSLVECELITGRTHQIRAQMADAGHPLLGDGKYGVNREDKKLGYKFQALYSYYLEIDGKEYTVDKDKIWFVREFE